VTRDAPDLAVEEAVEEEPALVPEEPELAEAVLAELVVAGEEPLALATVGAPVAVVPKETEVVVKVQLLLGGVMTSKEADGFERPVLSKMLRLREPSWFVSQSQVKEVALV